MTTSTNTINALLERILRAIIDNDDSLEIRAEELTNRVNWSIGVHIDDQGKVIGKKACHIKALQFLLARIGIRYGMQYRIEVREPAEMGRSRDNAPRIAKEYDPEEAADLLVAILLEVLDVEAIAYRTELDGKDSEGRIKVRFVVQADTKADYEALTMDCDPIGRGTTAQSVEAALGTLFRAYGLVEGVAIVVEIRQ